MRTCFPAALLVATLLVGFVSGCGKVVEDMDQQLDRRQVDTYRDETPPPEDATEVGDPNPSDGDEAVGSVEATGGH